MADLAWMRRRGLDRAVVEHAAAGLPVLGICGGFQMLGRTIEDPDAVEGPAGTVVEGLGLLDTATLFAADKVQRLSYGLALGAWVSGYEIHHGVVRGSEEEFLGGARRGRVFGTMWHGTLESDAFRTALLGEVAAVVGRTREASGVSFHAARQARVDLLADLLEENLDLEGLLALVGGGPPDNLPELAPGVARTDQ
jgi:adenosylcobyric acid synthase